MVQLVPGGLDPEVVRLPEQGLDAWRDPELPDCPSLGTGFEERGGTGSPSHPVVASLDLGSRPGDVEANLQLAEEAIAGARRTHPDLRWVVLPELFTAGYTGLGSVHRYAEDAGHGMSVWRLSALAHSLGVYIAYGFPERLPGGGVADSVNLVGPDGPGALLTYRKRNLVQTNEEPLVFVPGSELSVVEVGGMRVALVICWDLGFPEVVREAALAGAELILAPAAWRDPWGVQYRLSCAARALDNGVYLASANQQGAYPDATFGAPGGVYGPDGGYFSGSVGRVDHSLPGQWRAAYGSTMYAVPGHVFGHAASSGSLEEIC